MHVYLNFILFAVSGPRVRQGCPGSRGEGFKDYAWKGKSLYARGFTPFSELVTSLF